MDQQVKRKRRKSIRNLRRQSVILLPESDDTVPVDEQEYGSVWVESVDMLRSTKHSRRASQRADDWSPVELPRLPVKDISPKDMTPCSAFTKIKSLERQVTGLIVDNDVQQQNDDSMNESLLGDIAGVIPDCGIFYKKKAPLHTSPYDALLYREVPTLSHTVGFRTPDFSPQCSPLTPNICNTGMSVHELSNSIPEDFISNESCYDVNSNMGEPMDKDALYTALITQQSLLCSEMDDSSNTQQSEHNMTAKRQTHDLYSSTGDHPVQMIKNSSGEQISIADIELIGSGSSCACDRLPQIKQLSNVQIVMSNNRKTPVAIDTDFIDVGKESDTKCYYHEFPDMEYISVAVAGNGNNEWNVRGGDFHTPKSVTTPKQIQAKNLDSGSANKTSVSELAKKNRRRSNCFFEGLSVPMPKKSKESSLIPVDSVMGSQDEEENLPFLPSIPETIDEVSHTVGNDNESSITVAENDSFDVITDLADGVVPQATHTDGVIGSGSKPEPLQQASPKKYRRRRSSASVTENKTFDDVITDLADSVISRARHIDGTIGIGSKPDPLQQASPKKHRRRRSSMSITEKKTSDVITDLADSNIAQTTHTDRIIDNGSQPESLQQASPKKHRRRRSENKMSGVTTDLADSIIPQTRHTDGIIGSGNKPEPLQQASLKKPRRRRSDNKTSDDVITEQADSIIPQARHIDEITGIGSKPEFLQQALPKKSRRRKSLITVTENDTSDLNSEQIDKIIPNSENSEKNDLVKLTYAKKSRNRRKSADLSCVEEISEEVCYTRTRSCRQSLEMGTQQNKLTLDSVQGVDGTKSAQTESINEAKQKKVRQSRKKTDENLDIIYRNKNFKMPAKKALETIYEDPHDGTLVSKKKQHRILSFEYVPVIKQKRRQQKAGKLGWDVTGKNRISLPDEYVTNVINSISEDLAILD